MSKKLDEETLEALFQIYKLKMTANEAIRYIQKKKLMDISRTSVHKYFRRFKAQEQGKKK